MDISSKLDKLLEDVAVVRTKSEQHTSELNEIKEQLKPVLYHVNGMRWAIKLAGGIIGVIACAAAVLALKK